MITGTFFRLASIRLPRTPSQFTGLMKIAAGCCWRRSEMSFFCLRLLNWASSVTSRSPCASITLLSPCSRSTKNGLFIVWTVNPKSRPADVWPDGGLAAAVVDCGSPPQPVKVVDIHNIARQKCGRNKGFMVGIAGGSPGWRGGSIIARSSSLWETRTGQLNLAG